MDGTLVETESLWEEAECQTMAAFGSSWSEEEQIFALGGPFDMVIEYMAQKAGAKPTELAFALAESIEGLMRSRPLDIQPGIVDLHTQLHGAGIPTGLVTNSFRRLVDIVLESSGLAFDVTVAGDELPENKPHPLPYEHACAMLGVSPQHVVVLEDSTTGITSAASAGCFVVAIPHLAELAVADRQLIVPSATEINLELLRRLVAD